MNCALGIINTIADGDVATTGSADGTKALGCVACKPGYAPV